MVTEMTYYGKPAQYRTKLDITMIGLVMLELIESVKGEGARGLRHLGFFVR